jgi:lysophospholipase L1-like esterase
LVVGGSANAPKVVTSDLVKGMAFRTNGLLAPAPTITHNAATQYPTGATNQFVRPDSTVFRISGLAQLGTTFGTNFDINPLWISPLAGQRSTWKGAVLIAFDFDGQAFEFRQRGAATNGGPGFRLWANEKAHAAALEVGNTASASPSGGDFVKVDFGTAAYRPIVIEMVGNGTAGPYFYGCSASIKDTFYPSSIRTSKLFHVGDSFGQAAGTNSDDQGTGFVHNCARLLGIADINNGTSVTTTGPYHPSGTFPSYLQRITEDVIPAKPDVVVVQGSMNDANDYPAQSAGITAAVQGILSALKAGLPNAVIVMTSPMVARVPTAGQISVGGLYKPVCDAMNVPYIDALGQYAPFWFNGTGNLSLAANDGNADKYCDTDNPHPRQAGHDQLARLMARALAPLLNVAV